MANSSQAIKRARQNKHRASANASKRSSVRTSIKKTLHIINSQDVEQAKEAYKKTARLLDQQLCHHRATKNKAARIKSRLHKKLKQLTQAS